MTLCIFRTVFSVYNLDFRSAIIYSGRRVISAAFLRLVTIFRGELTMEDINKLIIDAHMHLPVDPVSLEQKKDALFEEMRKNGVSKGVVISDSELASSIGSLADCAGLFAGCADIAVVGGISPYINYEEQLVLMGKLLGSGLLAGIKLFCGHEPIYLTDGNLDAVYILAERFGVPVLFHSGWDNSHFTTPEIIREAAEIHRKIKLVCCHCCYPRLDDCFSVLADCENVYFDLSSVADGSNDSFIPILEAVIHAMPERFIFGSDYGSCDQAEHLQFFSRLNLTEQERRLVFCENARMIYGL